MGGFAILLLSYGLIALKSESRYLVGILFQALVMFLFSIPVVIYATDSDGIAEWNMPAAGMLPAKSKREMVLERGLCSH